MYETVDTLSDKVELKENVAYEPVKQSQKIELEENVALQWNKINHWMPNNAQ